VAYAATATRLVPPALGIGTEIDLGPGGEHDLSVVGNVAVGKSKGKRGGSTNDGAGGGVLRSVARAHELVVGGRPRDDAAKMGAYGVKAVRLKSLVILDDEVGSISLEALGERSITGGLLGKVILGEKVITEGVLGGDTPTSAAGTRGDEEGNVGDGKSSDGNSRGTDEDEVHEVTTVLVDVELIGRLGHVKADGPVGGGHWGRGESGGGAEEGGEESGDLHDSRVLLDKVRYR